MLLSLLAFTLAILSHSSITARRICANRPTTKQHQYHEFHINEKIGQFGMNLFKNFVDLQHHDDDNIENILFSPISLYYSLALAHLGAEGDTRDELAHILGAPSDEQTIYKWHQSFSDIVKQIQNSRYTNVSVYNELFVQNGFHVRNQYANFIKKFYNSTVESVDFTSQGITDSINEWFASLTHGNIPRFYDVPLSHDVKLLLANALSFGGQWDQEFPSENTHAEYFRGEDGEEQQISMMHKTDKVLHYNNVEYGYEAIGIPYSKQEYYLYLILPSENVNLKKLSQVLTYSNIQQIVDESQQQTVDIKLPSLKMKANNRVKTVLAEMGIGHLFQDANWSKMLVESQLKVSEIWHYVELNVNEKGSDISAGTTEEFKIYSPQIPVTEYNQQFYVQKPYLFFIYHPLTKTVLFYGSISKITDY